MDSRNHSFATCTEKSGSDCTIKQAIAIDILVIYREIPIVSPGLIFFQKAFLVGLFSGRGVGSLENGLNNLNH